MGRSDADMIADGKLSSYANVDLAEETIAKYMKDHKSEIINWSKNAPGGLFIDAGPNAISAAIDMGKVVGRGFDRTTGQVVNCTKARVVLTADGRGGWHIYTSYPTP
jgi:hypothetical protein